MKLKTILCKQQFDDVWIMVWLISAFFRSFTTVFQTCKEAYIAHLSME